MSSSTNSQLQCAVCGDHASSNSYGVPSCESCEQFFHNAQSPKARLSPCIPDTCSDKCPYCHYQQCVTSGMRYPSEHQICMSMNNMKL